MKDSNTFANIAAMKQLEREILLFTRRQCMKESNTLANIAARKQLKHQKAVHEGMKHLCKHCSYEATTKRNIAN